MQSKNEELENITEVPFWWHTIDLGGCLTPGQTSIEIEKIRASAIPMPLKGKTVLDIGCWDGYFSFECEEKGARVTAVDDFQYRDFVKNKYDIDIKGGEGFEFCHKWLGSKVQFHEINFTELKGTWDVVLFMGIVYHQRHPLLALEHLYRLTHETAVVETHYRVDENNPTLTFYAGDELNMDPTNYWGPSISCMEKMLRDVGFESVKLIKQYRDNDNRAIFIASKANKS